MRLITNISGGISNKNNIEILTENIISTGFFCKMCGECCLSQNGENIVIVSPSEIRKIMSDTSLKWDQIAEPYPEFIEENGAFFTFGWILKRNKESCVFFRERKCSIYESRPYLCRTYPFMIAEDALFVSECTGIGSDIRPLEAERLASDILQRSEKELIDEKMIEMAYNKKNLSKGCYYVIDAEGVKKIDR